MELIKDYDCVIDYHPGKANVVADALSRKIMQMLRALKIGSHRLLPLVTFFLEQLLIFCHLSRKLIKISKFHTLEFFPQLNVQTSLSHFHELCL